MFTTFRRVLKYVWPYRNRVAAAWVCAGLVAVLYFVSITTLLPLFTVLFDTSKNVVVGVQVKDPGTKHEREEPFTGVPPGFEIVKAEPGATKVEVDLDAKRVYVPAGYRTIRGGLWQYVDKSEGKKFLGFKYHDLLERVVSSLPKERWKILFWIMVFTVSVTAVRGVLRYVNGSLIGSVASRATLDIRHRAFDHVLRLPLGYFQKSGTSDASNRLIMDAYYIQEGIGTIFGTLVIQPLQTAAMLVLAIYMAVQIDSRILLLAVIVGPVGAIVIRTFATKMRRATKRLLMSASSILGILEEALAGLRVVKAYSMEGRERKRFFREGRQFLRFSLKAFKTRSASGPTLEFIATLLISVALVIFAYILESGAKDLSAPMVIAFFGAMVAAFNPMRKLADVNNRLQMARNSAERIFELIDAAQEQRSGRLGLVLPRLERELAFERIGFYYNQAAGEVLHDVSLRIAAGETIAVVGRTGCGKSTLVNMIPRFYIPTSGRITIDGSDIQDVTLRSLRDQIGLVSQDTMLFKDTIANNIAYGSRPAMRKGGRAGRVTREEIIAAAEMAHAAEFIVKMPGGYDGDVGTLGQTLSGGQRQRLALARAIIRDPAILILDEATSALDEETQMFVQDTLERFSKGRTVIIIAHRLSTISLARRIVVMDAGRIVDVGEHEELLSRCDLYRRLRETGFQGG
jgi:ABC-type multidrug transport system fused ATPase/permease subunit